MKFSLVFILLIGLITEGVGQGPISGFMNDRGKTAIALNYAFDEYNEYVFETNRQFITTTTQSINLFVEHGITDSLSIVFTAPYVWIDSSEHGFQDATLMVKYLNQVTQDNRGTLNFITSAGVGFPLSDYAINIERPIGPRATVLRGRLLVQYKLDFGLFFHLQSGIDFRILPQSQGAIPSLFRIGLGTSSIYAEAWVEYFNTFSNVEVDNQIFVNNGSDWWKIGGSIYVPINQNVGLNGGISYFLDGQNIGLSTIIHGGMVFNFDWTKK